MRSLQYILFLLCLIVAGCTTSDRTIALIEQSERVVVDYPDSALLLIRSVDPDRVYGRRDKAHYRLAMSEAMYYNRIDCNCDSLTRPLFDYYYDSDLHAERARAMYQHGLVMQNAHSNAEAMFALMAAEKSLQHYDNPRLLGLVYRTMGEIYGSECLHRNALSMYYKSYDLFNQLDLDFHSTHILHNIGESLYILREYELAEEYIVRAKNIAIEKGYDQLLSLILFSLCDVYLNIDNIEELGNTITLFDERKCHIYYELNYYFYKAIYSASLGHKQEALTLMAKAEGLPNNARENIEQFKYILYRYLGDINNELYWMSKYIVQQDELLLSILELPILNTQIELLEQDVDIAKERAQNMRFRFAIGLMLLSFAIVAVVLLLRHRMIVQRHEIECYISMISELKQNYANSSLRILSEFQGLFSNKLSNLNTLLEAYYEHGNTSRESYKIVDQVKSIVDSIRNDGESIAQMEHLVNLRHNDIISSIKSANVRFSDKELRYIIYMLSNLSNRSMCLLLDIDDAALYRIKYKVKSKMLECGFENEVVDLFAKR